MPALIWDDTKYVMAYRAARAGSTDRQIAQMLGYAAKRDWDRALARRTALRHAITAGREDRGDSGSETFVEYVYKQLPDDLQRLWDRINACGPQTPNRYQRVQALLDDSPRGSKHVRQHLFIHAFVASNFNATVAMKKLAIPYSTYKDWQDDEGFFRLMEEMEFHKKNYFEAGIVDLVRRRNPAAVLHVNKTINRDRGYGTRVDVQVSGTVDHLHSALDLDSLDLTVEVRRALLEAIRKRNEATQRAALAAPTVAGRVIDVAAMGVA